MKKFFMLLLCLCTLAFVVITPSAADKVQPGNDYDVCSEEAIQRYIECCSLEPKVGFGISQAVQINGSEDGNIRVVFLFDGDDCVGMMFCAFVNGEFASSFIPGSFPKVSEVLSGNEPFALLSYKESLYLLSGSSCYALTGRDELNDTNAEYKPTLSDFESVIIVKSTLNYKIEPYDMSGLRAIGNELDVDYVANANSPDTGKGLCWAASSAAIIRYRTNTHSLTALQLYNQLKSYYPTQYYGLPKGNKNWIKRCFYIHNLSKTYVNTCPTFNTIRGIIDNNLPIYISLSTDSSANVSHALVIVGYGSAYGYNNYILMDSNISTGYVVVAGSNSGTTPFIYVDGYTYSQFNYYVY